MGVIDDKPAKMVAEMIVEKVSISVLPTQFPKHCCQSRRGMDWIGLDWTEGIVMV